MTNELKTSFSDLDATAFRTYAADLLDAYPSAPERQRLQAYMLQTIASDRQAIEQTQADLSTKRFRRSQHQSILEELVLAHAHDYQRSSSLFVEQSKTDTEIVQLLLQDDAEVFLSSRNIASDITFSGDRVKLCGLNYTGSAAENTLAPSCVVTGRIIISGSDVTIEGIHFKYASQWTQGAAELPLISFSGGTNQKLTLKNCVFEHTGGAAGAFADGRFFCGAGSGGGVQVIEGCVIKNFTSWLLLDATTNSGAASVKLDSFKLDSCRIDNCMGSFAVRGQASDPNTLVEFMGNTVAFGSLGQHTYFWSCFESNNQLRVICEDNTVTGAANGGYASNRQFFQTWSRSARPWTVRYQRNAVSGFYVAVACACVATFYAPDYYSSDYLITATAAELSNVEYGASFVWDTTDSYKSSLSYGPSNVTVYPTAPPTSLASFSNRQ